MKYFILLLCDTRQVKNHKGLYYTRLKGRGGRIDLPQQINEQN